MSISWTKKVLFLPNFLYSVLIMIVHVMYSLNMKDAVLEDGNHFERVNGMNLYEYMEKNPTLNNAFNKAMVGRSASTMKKIVEIYEGFEGLASLVDVGGGTGSCLNMIVSKYPSIKGINFDLPHVVQTAPTYPGTNQFYLIVILCSKYKERKLTEK